jgi:hypothetical protein
MRYCFAGLLALGLSSCHHGRALPPPSLEGSGVPSLSDSALYFLYHGCPPQGVSGSAIRTAYGSPSRTSAIGPDSELVYDLGAGSELSVRTHEGLTASWVVRLASLNWNSPGTWRLDRGVRSRARSYAIAHPEATDSVMYLITQGCPSPGMTTEQLRASFGAQLHQRDAPLNSEWLVRLGIHGEMLILRMQNDLLTDNRVFLHTAHH